MSFLNNFAAKLTLRQRLLLLLLGAILLLALILSLTVRDRFGLTLFQRAFTYDNVTGTVAYSHGIQGTDLFHTLDDTLVACSVSALHLYSPAGESLVQEAISFKSPALSSNGKTAVVYDAGGQTLFVLTKGKIATTLTLPPEQFILSATINSSGWMAVTSKEDGYKGVVTVYDASFKPVVAIRLSSTYLTNAMVTPNCSGVYVLNPGQRGGVFESLLLYYDLSGAETPLSQVSLNSGVALTMVSQSNRTWVLGEQSLFTLLSTGELATRYDYGGRYLKRANLDGNGFAAVLLSNSQTGNAGTLVTVDAEGVELGSLEIQEQVLGLSAAGRYVAVLTSSSLRVFTKDLEEISSSDQIPGVGNLALYEDGSVALITNELVRLYLP